MALALTWDTQLCPIGYYLEVKLTQTVGGTEYSCLGIEQAVFLAACYLCCEICTVCLLVSRRCWAYCWCLQGLINLQEWVPDSQCCTNKTAISGCFSTVLFKTDFFFLQSVGPAIFLSAYTAIAKTQLHSTQARKSQIDRSFTSITDRREFLMVGQV